jgi:hypothetical protein
MEDGPKRASANFIDRMFDFEPIVTGIGPPDGIGDDDVIVLVASGGDGLSSGYNVDQEPSEEQP